MKSAHWKSQCQVNTVLKSPTGPWRAPAVWLKGEASLCIFPLRTGAQCSFEISYISFIGKGWVTSLCELFIFFILPLTFCMNTYASVQIGSVAFNKKAL